MSTKTMEAGGYRYIPGVMQYSAGVAALPGFRIRRVRFSRVVPLAEGFQLIRHHIEAEGRPLAAFCACELRSPGQFSEEGFVAFNTLYTGTLRDWGIMSGDDNPVGRANICPELTPPPEPGFHAFCYTVPSASAEKTFVVAGSGEAPEGKGNYQDHILRRGETGVEALTEKARWVLDEMERRMAALGGSWAETTATQVYCVHDIHPFFGSEIVSRGAAQSGIDWHYNRPPVVNLEYEMDCRRILDETILPV